LKRCKDLISFELTENCWENPDWTSVFFKF